MLLKKQCKISFYSFSVEIKQFCAKSRQKKGFLFFFKFLWFVDGNYFLIAIILSLVTTNFVKIRIRQFKKKAFFILYYFFNIYNTMNMLIVINLVCLIFLKILERDFNPNYGKNFLLNTRKH